MEIVPLPSNGNQKPEISPTANTQNSQPLLSQSGFIASPLYNDIPQAHSGYYPYDKPPKEETFNLREFMRKIWRRKWLVLALVSIITTLTALRVSQAKNIYQSTATIEIGRRNSMLGKDSLDYYYYGYDDQEIKTAIFLLQSTPLLEDVVVNLKLDQNPRFLEVTEQRSLLELFQRKTDKHENAQSDAPPVSLPDDFKPNLEQRSSEESGQLAPFVGLLVNGLNASQLRGTRLVNISYTHTDPELAAVIANGIARTYRERVFNKQIDKYEKTSDWLDKTTRDLQAQQQKAEQALTDYTRNNNIFATEAKDDLTTTKLANLNTEVMKAETERMLKQSLYEEVRRGNVAKLPEAFSNASTVALQQKLGELAVQSAQMGVKLGARNPKVIEVQQQIEAIRKEIEQSRLTLEEKLKADYERAMRDEAALKGALSRAKSEAVQQNQSFIQYSILKQQVETAKALYQDFLQKTKQADIERMEQSRNISIAQPATFGSIVGPRRGRTILIALLLSLALSVGLVYLLDHLDNRIKTVEDVNRYVGLPALGVIPAIDEGAPRKFLAASQMVASASGYRLAAENSNVTSLANQQATHSVAEAYRALRTSVLLAAAGRPPKTILVTSSQPGEGKTTTTVNTAICLSQLGAKVLLIDADMRRPRVHKAFGIKNQQGLSTYLSNEIRLRELIQPTGFPNLWVLPSGVIPPNSADLVSSEKMRYLLQKLSTYYDHILVDSPPVHSCTDPVILSRQVDGVILVVHGGRSTREMVGHARQELINVGAKIFGVVLNNVNVSDNGYEYYYHRYYYGRYKDDQSQLKGA